MAHDSQKIENHTQSAYGLGSLWREKEEHKCYSFFGMVKHHSIQAWKSFLTSPITSILTVITITITLLVLSLFILIVENVRGVVSTAQTELVVSLYIKDGIRKDQIDTLKEEITSLPFVEKISFKDSSTALEEFRKSLGERAIILEGLESENPLPASLEVKFKRIEGIDKRFKPFADLYRVHEAIEHVEYSRGVVDRLGSFLKFFRWGGWIAIIFMLAMTSFIITNTIKLALYSHREEIEIMKLVGATDSFVRAPYMIEGFFQGLLGGIISIFAAYSCYLLVQDILLTNELLRMLIPAIRFMSLNAALLVVISGIFVGVSGSYLAVKKFIGG